MSSGALPSGWTTSSVTDVADVERGVTFPASAKEYEKSDSNIACLRTSHIQHRLVWNDVYYVPDSYVKREEQVTRYGDILMSMANSANLVGKVVINDAHEGACFGAFLSAIRVTGIETKYLYYLLRSEALQSQLRSSATQTVNIANISVKTLAAAKLPLAPLAEQKQIAAKLDELLAQVDTIKSRLDAIPAILKRFRQSVLAAAVSGRLTENWRKGNPDKTTQTMLERFKRLPKPARYKSRSTSFIKGVNAIAVGKPNECPVSTWEWVPLVDVARMESGHTPSRSKPEYWGGDVPWIGIRDARENHAQTICKTEQFTNQLGLANSASRLLPENTVCISRTASVGYVVKTGAPMATSQDFVNWVPSEVVNPDWLKWLFVAEKESLFRFGKGSTHTTVYFPEWLSMHVALPHIDEQAEFVRRVDQLFTFADQVEQRLQTAQARVNHLTQSILTKAFRGELTAEWREQNPDLISGENSAEALLSRIRQRRAQISTKRRRRRQTTAA